MKRLGGWKSWKQEVSQAFQTQYLKHEVQMASKLKFLCCSIDILNNP